MNGDGVADILIGARRQDSFQINDHGRAYLLTINPVGRSSDVHQVTGPGASLERRVPEWGRSGDPASFRVSVDAVSPRGRELGKLEVEFCTAGISFGDPACEWHESASWTDLGTTGATLVETITPSTPSLGGYRWRSRVLYAPFSSTSPGVTIAAIPSHSPWRRNNAQTVEADIFLPEPRIGVGLATALLFLVGAVRTRHGAQSPRNLRSALSPH